MTDVTFETVKSFLGAWPGHFIDTYRPALVDGAPMPAFAFTNKTSYLAWVKEWKRMVVFVEATIRQHKKARKGDTSGRHQTEAHRYRQVAHALMIQRVLAKRMSGQLRAARLAELEAVPA